MAGWKLQLARGAGCCQMLLNLTVLCSHGMSPAFRVFSFNSYLGAKCTKYLRQALLLTPIIHHWFCYYSTPKRGHNDSDPRRPVKECTDHGTGMSSCPRQAQQGRCGPKTIQTSERRLHPSFHVMQTSERREREKGFPGNNIPQIRLGQTCVLSCIVKKVQQLNCFFRKINKLNACWNQASSCWHFGHSCFLSSDLQRHSVSPEDGGDELLHF